MKYPNQYNAPDTEIEIDQHTRAYNAALRAADNLTLSAAERACYRAQAEAELQHIVELRARQSKSNDYF